jgi:hypothetical protein
MTLITRLGTQTAIEKAKNRKQRSKKIPKLEVYKNEDAHKTRAFGGKSSYLLISIS